MSHAGNCPGCFAGFLADRPGMFFQAKRRPVGGRVTELNRFVVFLALPALAVDILAGSTWEQLWQPGFIPVFLLRFFRKKDMAVAAIEATAASCANTGLLAFRCASWLLARPAFRRR